LVRHTFVTFKRLLDRERPPEAYEWISTLADYLLVSSRVAGQFRSEEQSGEAQERLRLMLDNAPVVMFSINQNRVFTLSEGAGLSKLGLEPGQVVGAPVSTVYGDFPDILATIDQAFAGETVTQTNQIGPITFQTTYSPILRDGEVLGVTGLAVDTTDQTAAIAMVNEQQQFLQTVLDALPSRVFWKNIDLIYMGCNMAFARDGGMESPDDLIGKSDYDMPWAETEAELYQTDDAAVIESGESRINFEESQTNSDGSMLWLRTSKIALRDASGAVNGVLGMYEDITAQKEAQVERERLQQQVIDAQQETLKELSSPIIPLLESIIVVPLVGSIDSYRAREITRGLLAGIGQYRAKIVILDITGVSVVDSGVADHLNKTIQAARLKGAQTIVTGVSDAVAETIIDLGIDWTALETLRDLNTGMMAALERRGFRLSRV
jgi:rsbT co-antagonist protein RsbR